MKVLIKEDEKVGYEYKEWPIPEPQEGELLVKVLVSSICGSDIALYNWNEGKMMFKYCSYKIIELILKLNVM